MEGDGLEDILEKGSEESNEKKEDSDKEEQGENLEHEKDNLEGRESSDNKKSNQEEGSKNSEKKELEDKNAHDSEKEDIEESENFEENETQKQNQPRVQETQPLQNSNWNLDTDVSSPSLENVRSSSNLEGQVSDIPAQRNQERDEEVRYSPIPENYQNMQQNYETRNNENQEQSLGFEGFNVFSPSRLEDAKKAREEIRRKGFNFNVTPQELQGSNSPEDYYVKPTDFENSKEGFFDSDTEKKKYLPR